MPMFENPLMDLRFFYPNILICLAICFGFVFLILFIYKFFMFYHWMLICNFLFIPNILFDSNFIRFILKFFVAWSFLLDGIFFKDLKNKPIFWCWFPNKNFLNDRKNKMGRRTYKNLNGKNNEFKRIGVLKNRSKIIVSIPIYIWNKMSSFTDLIYQFLSLLDNEAWMSMP